MLDVPRADFQKYATAPYEDTVANGKTYYYAAFAYSDHDVYNRSGVCEGQAAPTPNAKLDIVFTASEAATYKITAKKGEKSLTSAIGLNLMAHFELDETGEWIIGGQKLTVSKLGDEFIWNEKIWGFDWELKEADTERSISYPVGVDNAKFTPVPACGADAEIDLGDWWEFHEWTKARPVMLNFDGTVAYELNHNDQTKKKDGGASDISDTTKSMNAMVEMPKRYKRRWTTDDGIAHFRTCRLQLGDGWKCYNWMYGTTEDDAVELDYIYLPMFEGSSVNSKVRSIADQTPMNSQTISIELTQVQALGQGWQFEDYADESLITDYMFLMARSTDVQKHWGMGNSNTPGNVASTLHKTGLLKEYGPYYGGTGNTAMKIFWMENYYSNRWTRSMGIVYLSNTLWAKDFPPYTTNPSEATEKNGWKNLGHGVTGTSNGYISEVTYDEHGMLPKTVSGSQTTYVPDICAFKAGNHLLLWGNCCNAVYGCGCSFGFISDAPSWGEGPSLAYKKPAA